MKSPNKSALVCVLLLTSGCDPLLGGRCEDGWIPSPLGCGSSATVDAGDAGARDGGDTDDLGGRDGGGRDTETFVDSGDIDSGNIDGGEIDGGDRDVGDRDVGDEAGDSGTVTRRDSTVGHTDTGCTPPEVVCNANCVNPAVDRANCGRCGLACSAGEVCAGGVCSAVCAAPWLLCNGECIDPMTDPENCGRCGVVCSTGICNGGQCRDARAGHLVLIGHDYQTTRVDQNRVVGNAVFLAAAAVPRVANFIAWARSESVVNVRAAIRQVAGARTFTERTITSQAELASAFSVDENDVVLVQHQAMTTEATLSALALRIAGPAVGFMRAGGVVIVLDGEATHPGTWPIASTTGLIEVSAHFTANFDAAELVDGADAVAIGLPVAYRAERSSVVFDGTSETGTVVRAAGMPLVLHRVVFGL